MMSGTLALGDILARSSSSTVKGGSNERSHSTRTVSATWPKACMLAAPRCCCMRTRMRATSSSLTYSNSRRVAGGLGKVDIALLTRQLEGQHRRGSCFNKTLQIGKLELSENRRRKVGLSQGLPGTREHRAFGEVLLARTHARVTHKPPAQWCRVTLDA